MSKNINFKRFASNSFSGPLGTNLVLLLSPFLANALMGCPVLGSYTACVPGLSRGAPANAAGSKNAMLAAPRAAANMSTNSRIDLFIATPRFPLQSLGYESFNLGHFPSV